MDNSPVTPTTSSIVPISRVEPSSARKARANMFRTYSALAALLLAAVPAQAAPKINVMTATQDLAAIAREVGGDLITADSIAMDYQDPHFVEPKPSLVAFATAFFTTSSTIFTDFIGKPPILPPSSLRCPLPVAWRAK